MDWKAEPELAPAGDRYTTDTTCAWVCGRWKTRAKVRCNAICMHCNWTDNPWKYCSVESLQRINTGNLMYPHSHRLFEASDPVAMTESTAKHVPGKAVNAHSAHGSTTSIGEGLGGGLGRK